MNKTVIYIVGATVLVGGAYLFLKNKKKQDLAKLDEIGGTTTGGATSGGTTSGGTTTGGTTSGGTTSGGTTSGGTTSGGTTSGGTTSSLSNTSDGVTPSDANLNLANATVMASTRKILVASANKSCLGLSKPSFVSSGTGWSGSTVINTQEYNICVFSKEDAKKQLVELDKKLATLGYKVDAIGQLVKI